MKIEEILDMSRPADQIIADLKQKITSVPSWGGRNGLVREYESKYHPVMNKGLYPDVTDAGGRPDPVTRITLDFQKLAVRRMTELVCGIPVKRVYNAADDSQNNAATWLERIFQRNRIDSVNIERCNRLFAGCEVMTLWYAVEQENMDYGFKSGLKIRCRTFSPMQDDELYPLFDEYGDLIALSVGYRRKVADKIVSFFDTYTYNRHVKWSSEGGNWEAVEDEEITLGKIPGVYAYRPTPIWEDTSKTVYEMEWALSRNGNYLRKNSKPLFIVFADEEIRYGDERDEKKEFRSVLQYPKGSSANYVTWDQAVENLKFYINELRNTFFTQLQLPDWSYEKMSQQALSGESRKQLFIDSQLKVKDESGRLLEFFDREVNVVKTFLKAALKSKEGNGNYDNAIDALQVETEITPFSISDDHDTITNLVTATGGKAIMSQREAVETLGWSKDVDGTMEQLREESQQDAIEAYV